MAEMFHCVFVGDSFQVNNYHYCQTIYLIVQGHVHDLIYHNINIITSCIYTLSYLSSLLSMADNTLDCRFDV